MNFLNPFFLFGLLAVAVPLVIHFINLRRPQKVAFSTLAFLNELKKSTLRRIRIKEYLLMALRVLAIILLTLALARPLLPPTLSGGASSVQPRLMALLIDNSSSMSRISRAGPLIDQAKQVAENILDEATGADRFVVTTTNGEALQSGLIGKEKARARIKKIEPVNAGNYTQQNYQYLLNEIKQSGFNSSVVYIMTDAQQTQFAPLKDFSVQENERAPIVQFIKLQQSSQQNTAVRSVALKNQIIGQGSPVTVEVEVQNMSETEAVNQFVSLTTGERNAGQYEVALEPGQSKKFLFEVQPDGEKDIIGKITLEGDEVSFDNNRNFVIHVPQTQSVLLISDANQAGPDNFKSYLKPALQAAGDTHAQLSLNIQKPDEVNPAVWTNNDAIILDALQQIPEYWFNALQQAVQQGKGLLFFPSEQGDIQNYNRFLGVLGAGSFTGIKGEYASFKPLTRVDQLAAGHPVLDGLFKRKKNEPISVDRPALFFYYQYQKSADASGQTILKTETGDPLLAEHELGEGKILVSAFGADPGWSNFPVNPLFAPLFYRSVLYAASGEQGRLEQHILGQPFEWQGKLPDQSVLLSLNEEEIKPKVEVRSEGLKLSYPGKEWRPGILHINSGTEKKAVAINQNIMESSFAALTKEKLDTLFQNSVTTVNMIAANEDVSISVMQQLKTANFGKEIWNWFLWATLVLLIIETFISKFYKAETIS